MDLREYQSFGSVDNITKANISPTPASVYAIRILNKNAAIRYFQLHNKATAPAAADVPLASWAIPAGSATAPGVLTLDVRHFGPALAFAVGLGWAISTTAQTFTDSATGSEHDIDVRWGG